MTEEEQAQYHLDTQAREIAEMSMRKEPFIKRIADIDITVFPKVYPGGIDSELTAQVLGDVAGKSVLDLCTGMGIVSLKAAQTDASRIVAVDLNPEAVKNAKYNAVQFGYDRIEVFEGSLFEPIQDEKFDVITINPPYTGKKPQNITEICFWDEDNRTTKEFFEMFRYFLKPGGRAYLAWADFSPVDLIEDLARQNDVDLRLVKSKKTNSGLATFLVYQIVV